MNILGINFSHDSSATLIVDGKIRFAVEEEKMSRIKQDFGWPTFAIKKIFESTGLEPKDIDLVSFGSHYYNEVGENELRYRFTKNKKHKNIEVINRLTSYLNLSNLKISEKNKTVFREELNKLGFVKAKLEFHNHHLCHAYSAHYASPFTPDLTITCDGHGDGESFNFYICTKDSGLKCIVKNDYLASIGQFYSGITKLLGFRPTRHEGKITGLAAFGKHTELIEQFSNLFYYENNALRRFPANQTEKYWEKYKLSKKIGLREKINLNSSESEIGKHYAMNAMILHDYLSEICEGHTKEDIAYACQIVSEEVVVKEVSRVYKEFFNGEKLKIALAGGVFANVRINQKIFELNFVENIFVQPAMGDAGLSLGAAMLSEIKENNNNFSTEQYRFVNTYLGIDYTHQLKESIANFTQENMSVVKMVNPAKEVAEKLADNKIIGFWHGPMEWGPRALGSRTIMLNTFDKSVNDSLNDRLNRTEFMPFAPVVLDFMAKEYFPKYDPSIPAGDYMTITYDTNPKYKDILQAVVHVDGTARPQVIRRETNEFYYDVLNEFYKISDCGALVNTSFNAHEEPIVSSPEVAINALKTNRVDYLVLDGYMISSEVSVLESVTP